MKTGCTLVFNSRITGTSTGPTLLGVAVGRELVMTLHKIINSSGFSVHTMGEKLFNVVRRLYTCNSVLASDCIPKNEVCFNFKVQTSTWLSSMISFVQNVSE